MLSKKQFPTSNAKRGEWTPSVAELVRVMKCKACEDQEETAMKMIRTGLTLPFALMANERIDIGIALGSWPAVSDSSSAGYAQKRLVQTDTV